MRVPEHLIILVLSVVARWRLPITFAASPSSSSSSSAAAAAAAAATAAATTRPPGINVIVVGGSSGMGKAAALEVIRQGGRVLLVSRNQDKLQRAQQELLRLVPTVPSSHVSTYSLDVTNESEVQAFAENYLVPHDHDAVVGDNNDDNIHVDNRTTPTVPPPSTSLSLSLSLPWHGLVITAAGRAAHGPVVTLPTSDTRDMMESKVWGAYHCAKHIGPKLCHNGSIVFCAGILNRRPGMNCAPLAMANGALEGLTKSLALEFGGGGASHRDNNSNNHKILRVNCLSPGFCDTERFDHMEVERKQRMLDHTASSLPLQRVGQPSDMGQAIYYLLTAPFCTGVILDVDGGHGIRQYANPMNDPMREKQTQKE
jgi:NAD(P)-dependent dehydrogenase (short-subunit alcohol dehydrogenase family)